MTVTVDQIYETAASRAEYLKKEINRHNILYHVRNMPEIDDITFDSMFSELKSLEERFPDLKTEDSPTCRVGGTPASGFFKKTHKVPMLSLDNTYSEGEIRDFNRRVSEAVSNQPFCYFAELKIDGLSISLEYVSGKLISAVTRGDGETGEDVTENIRRIMQIPLELLEPVSITVRGEIYFTLDSFSRINKEREAIGKELFANPRNAAAGTVRQLDPMVVAKRQPCFFAHSYGGSENLRFQSQSEMLNKLAELGFPVNQHSRICKDIDEVIIFCQKWSQCRNELNYEIDGIVIKLDFFSQQEMMGFTSRSPRWAMAFKYQAPAASTVVKDVLFQVGRTGVITPVAELVPVRIGGVTVKRASLHNFDEIKRLGLKIGDTVLVERAAEVIPHIVKVVDTVKDSAEIKAPEYCPSCNEKTVFQNVFLKCTNPLCPQQVCRVIENFASRQAMNIETLGPAVVELLVSGGLVFDVSDLYFLEYEVLRELPGFGDLKANKLRQNIEKSRSNDLYRLITGLGIPNVGEHLAEVLAARFRDLEKLALAEKDELMNISEIGPQTAESIFEFFRSSYFQKIREKLQQAGVNFNFLGKDGILSGKIFVVTGTLQKFSREEIHQLIRSLGGDVKNSVSRKTDFLIAGENAGSKLDKARKDGVKVLFEEEFLEEFSLKKKVVKSSDPVEQGLLF